jgi:hypothetical protein
MCDFDSWLEEIEAEEIAASILLIPAAANSNVSKLAFIEFFMIFNETIINDIIYYLLLINI